MYTFELHLGNNVQNIEKLPKFSQKSSLSDILIEISKLRPDLILSVNPNQTKINNSVCNEDRLLLSLFDDIALYNGYEASELPSPWVILEPVIKIKKLIQKDRLKNLTK